MIAFAILPHVFLTLYAAAWLLVAFLAGSVPFGWIVAKMRGLDIRSVGSGNIGMTNVWRALGWQYGVTVLVLDIAKGLVPVLALQACLRSLPAGRVGDGAVAWIEMGVGLAAILGHTFTPWLRFKGGKGVATAAGVLLALLHLWMAIPVAVLLLMVAVFRYVSLGNLVAALALGAMCFTVPAAKPYWPLGVAAVVLVFWAHRSNIVRIIKGAEPKVGAKRASARPEE